MCARCDFRCGRWATITFAHSTGTRFGGVEERIYANSMMTVYGGVHKVWRMVGGECTVANLVDVTRRTRGISLFHTHTQTNGT